jgi:2-phospho-L-lactate guanylyltransferase
VNELWAVVPVKCLTRSKQRLKGVLAPKERAELMRAMVRDVLTALSDVAGLDGILVTTRSAEIAGIASEFGAEVFAESIGADQSQAVMEANRHLITRHHAAASLMIPGDVPRITADDVNALVTNHEHVTLVPDSNGEGTNAVLTTPPDAISFQFGKGSLQLHLESASSAGLSPLILTNEHFAHDIDGPRDLYRALVDLPPSHTRDYLEHNGIRRRLESQQARPKESQVR